MYKVLVAYVLEQVPCQPHLRDRGTISAYPGYSKVADIY